MFKKLFDRQPKRRIADRLSEPTSCFVSGFLFEGEIEGEGHYLIQGEVVGEGRIRGIVTLAAGSYWKGSLTADVVLLAGRFDGNVVANERLDLAPTAQVSGDLTAPVISMSEGAVVESRISRPRKTQVTRYRERRGQGKPPTASGA